jgi:tRNA G46 methylase TrmB
VLADAVCAYLRGQNRQPEVLVEPTCGAGAFVLSALQHFPSLQVVYGVEIHAPYFWKTKVRILEWALTQEAFQPPRVVLACGDVFRHDFRTLAAQIEGRAVLVLGNPP